jgi:hypothetical protein
METWVLLGHLSIEGKRWRPVDSEDLFCQDPCFSVKSGTSLSLPFLPCSIASRVREALRWESREKEA